MNNSRRLAVALAVSLIPASAAFAGEGNGPSYPGAELPNVVVGRTVFGNATVAQLGSAANDGGVSIGSTVPSNSGSEGEPEPTNSLPRGFYSGSPGLSRQQAVYGYWANHPGRG